MRRTSVSCDGCTLSYVVRGIGPPVLFIQGVGVHGSGWDPQVESLSSRFECLTFDNRGIGASQPEPGRSASQITVSRMVADALFLMDTEHWESAHIVGHSMGGLLALELALIAPLRVRSLSLLCTFARGSVATTLTPAMLWTGLRTRLGTRAMRRSAFLELVMPPGIVADPVRIGGIFGHDLADQPPVVMKQLAAIRTHNVTPRLAELAAIPTLVVSAFHDRIAPPAAGREIAGGIPGSRYVEIANAAHGVPIQKPADINSLLAGHFDRAEGQRQE